MPKKPNFDVAQKKAMKNDSENKPVEVFEGTNWQAGMVKSLLENAEVETFLADEIIGTLNPWWTSPGGAGSLKVYVSSHDYENAKIIVAEYEKNLKDNSSSFVGE